MSLVFGGQRVDVPGLSTVSFMDDSAVRLKRGANFRPRKPSEAPTIVVVHSTKGWPTHDRPAPQQVHEREAEERDLGAWTLISYWRSGRRIAGAHVVLDADGVAYCAADLETEAAYHASGHNGRSVGIEVVQGRDAAFFRAQVTALPLLVGAVCARLGIPHHVAHPYRGGPRDASAPGVYGHRDLTDSRGFGDPGDLLMEALVGAGWMAF
jgi:hypothetical protein